MEPIKRPGCKVIAEIPAGATVTMVGFHGEPAWIVAHPDAEPYYLFLDGSTRPVMPVALTAPPTHNQN